MAARCGGERAGAGAGAGTVTALARRPSHARLLSASATDDGGKDGRLAAHSLRMIYTQPSRPRRRTRVRTVVHPTTAGRAWMRERSNGARRDGRTDNGETPMHSMVVMQPPARVSPQTGRARPTRDRQSGSPCLCDVYFLKKNGWREDGAKREDRFPLCSTRVAPTPVRDGVGERLPVAASVKKLARREGEVADRQTAPVLDRG